jgi:hypothetical protein
MPREGRCCVLFRSSVVPALALLGAFLAASCGGNTTGPSPTTAATTTTASSPPPASPAPTPVGPKSEYSLTFTASPSCSFPTGVGKRTYIAAVQEALRSSGERDWWVSLEGPEMMQGYGFFAGTRTGDTLEFDIGFGYGYGVIEVIDQTKPLFFDGVAHATISDGRVSGTFVGRIALYDSLSTFRVYQPAPYDCQATDHRIEFVGR